MPRDPLKHSLLNSESPPPSSPSFDRSVSTPGVDFFQRFQSNRTTVAAHQVIDDLVGVLNAVLVEDAPPKSPVLHKSASDPLLSMPRLRQAQKKLPPFSHRLAVAVEEKGPSNREEKKGALLACQICYEDEESAKGIAKACVNEECAGVFCSACIETFVREKVKNSLGTCPLIRCPSCTHFIPFSSWRQRVSEGLSLLYQRNAKSVLELQCGQCHTPRTLLKEFDEKVDVEERLKVMLGEIAKARSQKMADAFAVAFRQYGNLELTPMQFLDIIVDTFSNDGAAIKQLALLRADMEELNKQLTAYRASIDTAAEEANLNRLLAQKQARKAALKKKIEDVDKAKCCSFWTCLCCLFPCCPNTTPCFSCVNKLTSRWHDALVATNSEVSILQSQKSNISGRIDMLVSQRGEKIGVPPLRARIAALQDALNNQQVVSNAVADVLELIPDIERRSSLHLRCCIKFPTVKTLCCQYQHCFRCKIKIGHTGKSCEEYQGALTSQIKFCPKCNIALVKGDGCDSVSCVCGHKFAWAAAAVL